MLSDELYTNKVAPIATFFGTHRFLSNFYPCLIQYNGRSWTSVEAAYQAAKSTDPWVIDKFTHLTPSQAKAMGSKIALRPDWLDVRERIMLKLVMLKFTTSSDLADQLLATGHALLEEGNGWHDTFWGVCPVGSGRGQNVLGYILMVVRAHLRATR